MTEVGTILHLQRLSTEDGPGIRTTVFLKGCTLRCAWCHNPESFSPQLQVQRIETNCIHCGLCIQVCPQGCLQADGDEIILNHQLCDACGRCVQECPSGALELLGQKISVDELTNGTAQRPQLLPEQCRRGDLLWRRTALTGRFLCRGDVPFAGSWRPYRPGYLRDGIPKPV